MFSKKLLIFLLIIVSFLFCFRIYAAEKEWQEKKSTHFIIYYKKSVDRDFIEDIIETAERNYDEIAKNLGYYRYKFWLWDDRAKIYIYPDQPSFQKEMDQPSWSGGCASYQQKAIWTFPHAAGFFDSILPHELGHIVFREFVGFQSNIPLWFEEGVASYQEKSKRYAAKNIVKDLLVKDQLLGIEELAKVTNTNTMRDKERVEIFYAEAVSIIYFLINRYGNSKFAKLCKSLNDNMSFDKALKKSYYSITNTQDLEKEWIRYLHQ
ncbi:peptidase MA family metallohydrolase [Candidatus Omnitrophota bacterium]